MESLPGAPLCALFAYLKTTGLPSGVDDAMSVFDQWSRSTGLSKVRDGLAEGKNRFRATQVNLAAQVDSLSKTYLGPSDTALLRRITKGVSLAADHMTAAFLNAPERYILPGCYSRSVDQYVNPVVRKVYQGIAVVPSFTKQQLQERGFIVQSAIEREGQLLVDSLIEPYAVSSYNFYTPQDVSDFEALLQTCDYLVSETGRTDAAIQRVRHIGLSNGLPLPFELIG